VRLTWQLSLCKAPTGKWFLLQSASALRGLDPRVHADVGCHTATLVVEKLGYYEGVWSISFWSSHTGNDENAPHIGKTFGLILQMAWWAT